MSLNLEGKNTLILPSEHEDTPRRLYIWPKEAIDKVNRLIELGFSVDKAISEVSNSLNQDRLSKEFLC